MFASATEVPTFKINFASIDDADEDEGTGVRMSSGHRPKMPSRLIHNCQMPWRRKGEKWRADGGGNGIEMGGNGVERRSVEGSGEDQASSSEDDPELDVQAATDVGEDTAVSTGETGKAETD